MVLPFVRLLLVPLSRNMVAMALEGIRDFSQACETLLQNLSVVKTNQCSYTD